MHLCNQLRCRARRPPPTSVPPCRHALRLRLGPQPVCPVLQRLSPPLSPCLPQPRSPQWFWRRRRLQLLWSVPTESLEWPLPLSALPPLQFLFARMRQVLLQVCSPPQDVTPIALSIVRQPGTSRLTGTVPSGTASSASTEHAWRCCRRRLAPEATNLTSPTIGAALFRRPARRTALLPCHRARTSGRLPAAITHTEIRRTARSA
jgi:hypothetical protein